MDEIKIGDIVVIDSLNSQGNRVGRHSFVVIEDQNGEVCSLSYDFIALLMSSFKDEEQKKRKLKFPGNFPISADAEDIKGGHGKEGFIKAEQFYYFSKSKTSYKVIGELKPETLDSLMNFINSLPSRHVTIAQIIDNL